MMMGNKLRAQINRIRIWSDRHSTHGLGLYVYKIVYGDEPSGTDKLHRASPTFAHWKRIKVTNGNGRIYIAFYQQQPQHQYS